MNERESALKRLTLSQYEQIEMKVRSMTRGKLKGYLDESNLQGRDRFAALRDADPDTVTQNAVYHYLGTRRGAIDAIVVAATAAGMSASEADDFARGYDIVDATNLARYLVGFEKRLDMSERGPNGGAGEREDIDDPNSLTSAAS